jgi:ABC-type phosphate transport system auxiliary subunit
MSASIDEQVSSQERQKIWTESQSLRQDTQAFRAEAYRLRTAGSLDAATNERLRAQQQELERRGEDLLRQCAR